MDTNTNSSDQDPNNQTSPMNTIINQCENLENLHIEDGFNHRPQVPDGQVNVNFHWMGDTNPSDQALNSRTPVLNSVDQLCDNLEHSCHIDNGFSRRSPDISLAVSNVEEHVNWEDLEPSLTHFIPEDEMRQILDLDFPSFISSEEDRMTNTPIQSHARETNSESPPSWQASSEPEAFNEDTDRQRLCCDYCCQNVKNYALPCGHTVCSQCASIFYKESKKCAVCRIPLTAPPLRIFL